MKVSCIMPTRGRPEFAERALACYLAQTWPAVWRELIILDDCEAPSFPTAPSGPGVRYSMITGRRPIGEKRNVSCGLASGDYICHWDDDDISDAGRIADQVMRLAASGLSVTGYHTMRFADGSNWWEYAGAPDYALGTSLMYRRDYWESHRFPLVDVGEDNRFVRQAAREGQLVSAPAGALMVATIHAGNTSPRNLDAKSWRKVA